MSLFNGKMISYRVFSLPQFGSRLNWIMIWRKLSTSNKYCVYAERWNTVCGNWFRYTNTEGSSQEHSHWAMNDRAFDALVALVCFQTIHTDTNTHTNTQWWLMINANEHQDNGMLCRMWYNRFVRVRMQKTNIIGFLGLWKTSSSSGNDSRPNHSLY